ncbi:MAG: radical SAM protein [Candidatus Omnitrophota bacterium]|jgi:DNA repair photolyase
MNIVLANTQRVLSATQISLADYAINPYKGCEFGCLYCYAQENKNISQASFFNSLTVKANAPEILKKELAYKKPKRVLLGSTTECFPSQEIHYKITGQILKILNGNRIPYTILTKSHLIAEYLPLIALNPDNKIFFTLNFSGDRLIRLFEKKSPSLDKRLVAIKKIVTAGIHLRVHIGPFIPHVSNLEEILKLVPSEVKEVDVELYHKKQGNFNEVIEKIKKNISGELAEKIKQVYKDEKSYRAFNAELLLQIKQSGKRYPFSFYHIAPDLNQFYGETINYENSL